jgi:UDP-glucose 4-epimerase
MCWGDVINPADAMRAIQGTDAVIHLAAIVPPKTEMDAEATNKTNVGGTLNILDAIAATNKSIGFVFGSSASVMGPTQSRTPPINPYDPPNPTTNYTRSKIEIETYLGKSDLNYCICRIGAVLTTSGMYGKESLLEAFNMPLNDRIETISDADCATALANAAEKLVKHEGVRGKILPLGGGKDKGHQIYGRDFAQQMFEKMGMGRLDERCFSTREYFMDWMDTRESQALLQFQNHTYEETLAILVKPIRRVRFLFIPFTPLIRRMICKFSPYFKK